MSTPNEPTTILPYLPYTIATIIQQAGGRGLGGAFAYCGAHRFTYSCSDGATPVLDREWRSSWTSRRYSLDPSDPSRPSDGYAPHGEAVDADVYLKFCVNGKRGSHWFFIIAYEPNDTYTVWLCSMRRRDWTRRFKILDERRDIHCDNLKETIERTYDNAINSHCNGIIHV